MPMRPLQLKPYGLLAAAFSIAVTPAAATTPFTYDEFGAEVGHYRSFDGCAARPVAGIAEADVSALLNLAMSAPQSERYNALIGAVRVFTVNGLPDAAARART